MSVSETYPNDSYVWVSHYIKILDKEHIFFFILEDWKVLNEGKQIEVGKVVSREETIIS